MIKSNFNADIKTAFQIEITKSLQVIKIYIDTFSVFFLIWKFNFVQKKLRVESLESFEGKIMIQYIKLFLRVNSQNIESFSNN